MLKICSTCKEAKPLSDFGKHATRADGIHYMCKACVSASGKRTRSKNPEKSRARTKAYFDTIPKETKAAWARKWRANNRERSRDHMLKTHYGIPIGTYDKLFSAQNGKCAICGTEESGNRGMRFHVDHCHDTGVVRGLLCSTCNTGIGGLKHNKEILEAAILYLQRYT